jgi:hypothetical protein
LGGVQNLRFWLGFFQGFPPIFPGTFPCNFVWKKRGKIAIFQATNMAPKIQIFPPKNRYKNPRVPKKNPAKTNEQTPINFYQFSFLFFHIILHQKNWFISHDDNCFLLCQLWSRFDDKFARFGWRDGAGFGEGF